jgi:hypothetical protein
MTPLPRLNERDLSLIIRYPLDSDEEMVEAVVEAFLAAGVEVYNKPTQLVDWINTDVFEQLQWASDRPLYLSTRIWDQGGGRKGEEERRDGRRGWGGDTWNYMNDDFNVMSVKL